MAVDTGDRAVSVTVYDLQGSPLEVGVVAAIETAIWQIVWGSGIPTLAWDISYVEAT